MLQDDGGMKLGTDSEKHHITVLRITDQKYLNVPSHLISAQKSKATKFLRALAPHLETEDYSYTNKHYPEQARLRTNNF